MQNMLKLYKNLMALCVDDNTKFFFVDHLTNIGTKVRVFSYHVANYEDWIKPDALECRGIMFEMKHEAPVRIMSRPMEKFFNLNENPLTMNLDLSTVDYYMTKEDGSLISTYLDTDGVLKLKSKTSVASGQALDAIRWLYNGDRGDLLRVLQDYAEQGATVNMEWCSPNNRIVLDYKTDGLRILNVRMNDTGEYIDPSVLHSNHVVRKYMAGIFEAPEDGAQFVAETKKAQGIEGYVVRLRDGTHFKLKTDWYVALHHTKDSINNNKRLMLCCAEGVTDDLRQLFETDETALKKIQDFEVAYRNEVQMAYTKLVDCWNDYRGLPRKDYAINMTREFSAHRQYFGIAMNMFTSYSQESVIEQIIQIIKKYPEKVIPVGYSKD